MTLRPAFEPLGAIANNDGPLRLSQARLRTLSPTTFELGPGLHVVHSPDLIGVSELMHLLVGLEAPRGGLVTLRGRVPFTDPELRAKIGSCLPEEPPTDGLTLERALGRLGLQPTRLAAVRAWLENLAPDSLERDKPVPSTHLALALALSTAHPWALVLFEPFAQLSAKARAVTTEHLFLQSSDIPVLVVTASQTEAERLGGAHFELAAGILHAVGRSSTGLHRIAVVGHDLRMLASQLLASTTFEALRYACDEQGRETLELQARDGAVASRTIARTARETGAKIHAIRSSAVSP